VYIPSRAFPESYHAPVIFSPPPNPWFFLPPVRPAVHARFFFSLRRPFAPCPLHSPKKRADSQPIADIPQPPKLFFHVNSIRFPFAREPRFPVSNSPTSPAKSLPPGVQILFSLLLSPVTRAPVVFLPLLTPSSSKYSHFPPDPFF